MNTETAVVNPTVTARPVQEARTVWYRPAVDVMETREGFRLVLDVPGVPKDALEVQVENRRLTVQGRRATGNAGWRHAFTLPDTVDTENVGAELADGVLTLTLSRRPEFGPRRIEVG